ncbi:MAG: transposase [Chloroflexota bacterium]
MNHIGMDSHITTLEFAVVNEAGQLVKADRIATSVSGFMKFVRTVARPRTIYMEEGTLASWALETCVRFGEKLVITDPKENHWISSSGQKDDPIDALKLAQLGRGGYIKEIHHAVGQRRRFRELMIAYHDTVRSTTRIKNKIKARFRQNGIHCAGDTVYSESYRKEWKDKLPQEPMLLLILDGLWRQLEQSEKTEKDLLAAARSQAKNYPEIKNFQALSGIGFISAATISAMLETPYRFADKKKVWMYAGLGIMRRSSAGKVYSERLSTDYNRLLKYTVKQAAEAAIQTKDNPFWSKYIDMTVIHGIAPHRAKLTVSRGMLATMWAMWRKGEKYNPEIREQAAYKQG